MRSIMYADTHCHLSLIAERGITLSELLLELEEKQFQFVMDIGTTPGDLGKRVETVLSSFPSIPSYLFFSCGLWPSPQSIAEADESIAALERDLDTLLQIDALPDYAALGECGIDRHWNGKPPVPGGEGGSLDLSGEEDLFARQIAIARSRNLPVIVHSREAFDITRSIIANEGWSRGVIHCFSYGKTEARSFLDLGYYISFPATITWGKKSVDRDRIAELLSYVPQDRLLLETDAPYMAPVPHRGEINTPARIPLVYQSAALFLGITEEALAARVVHNARTLFAITKGLC